jgi:AMP nucleosidase
MTKAETIVSELTSLYDGAVERLRAALTAFIKTGERPPPDMRANGAFAYPEIRLRYRGMRENHVPLRSFGRLTTPGDYAISVTRPALFAGYLIEQLKLLIEDYDVEVEAVQGRQEIPFPYVLDPGHDLALGAISAADLARWFPATELADIGDEIADGIFSRAAAPLYRHPAGARAALHSFHQL